MHTVFRTMWLNWAISFGAVALLLFFALFTRKVWLPFIALGEVYFLAVFIRRRRGKLADCSLLPHLTMTALIITALIMLLINILCTDWLVPGVVHLDLYNVEIPFITCLVALPCLAAVCAFGLWDSRPGAGESVTCHRCRQVNGHYAGDSIIGTVYFREARYQLRLLLCVNLVLAAVEYWYYFFKYINNDFNTPDRVFFIWMPIVIYLFSLAIMYGRYRSMFEFYVSIDELKPERRHRTMVRFLVLRGDELLLKDFGTGGYDTPYQTLEPRHSHIDEGVAHDIFNRLTGMEHFEVKYLYTNQGLAHEAKIKHYAVFVSPDKSGALDKAGQAWYAAFDIDHILSFGEASSALAGELFRIHTMTMAWKTYDENGRRRYPVRNYRPTFRLGDLRRWDLNYNDMRWLDVANNNEDRAFFRLRRFWQRITSPFSGKRVTS